MPTFDELREGVTPDIQAFFDFLWERFLISQNWPTIDEVCRLHLEMAELESLLKRTSGCLVIQDDSESRFKLQLLGILCTSRGNIYRDLLKRLLSYLRDVYYQPEPRESVESRELAGALLASESEIADLGKVLRSGFGSMYANPLPVPIAGAWGLMLAKSTLRVLPRKGSVDSHFERMLNELCARNVHVSETERRKALFPATVDFDGFGDPFFQHPLSAEQDAQARTVFIVHGHDGKNLTELKELLVDEFGLTPVVLYSEPGKGRTIIEKFEDEAKKAGFAFVLLTPDDLIKTQGEEYFQARPNVVFELGWFYGRLTRKKVCLLFKVGTKIHSDLAGVSRIEFRTSVREKISDIATELAEAALISGELSAQIRDKQRQMSLEGAALPFSKDSALSCLSPTLHASALKLLRGLASIPEERIAMSHLPEFLDLPPDQAALVRDKIFEDGLANRQENHDQPGIFWFVFTPAGRAFTQRLS